MIFQRHVLRTCFKNKKPFIAFGRGYADQQEAHFVFLKALKYDNKIALVDKYGSHSYLKLYKYSCQLASNLNQMIKNGKERERIAILCNNDASYIISQWASWMAGHTVVPLHPYYPPKQLGYYVQDSGARLILTTSDLVHKVKDILAKEKLMVLDETLKPFPIAAGTAENIEINSSSQLLQQWSPTHKDDALIIYTSGSTGQPKGVVLTHGNVNAQIDCMIKPWGWTNQDVLLHTLPLNHTHGIVNALLCPLSVGARVVMVPKFDVVTVWDRLLSMDVPFSERVTVFMAVPTIYAKLIDYYDSDLKSSRVKEYVKAVCQQNVRLMVSGSAALPQPIFDRWKEITGHTLLERYGMTEIGMALSNPLKGERKPGFVGNPLPSVEAKIMQVNTGLNSIQVICHGSEKGTAVVSGKDSEIGELFIRGPNVFKEYWNKPEETAKEFIDGWFRTGDTAQFTDGAYKILGRTSVDIIKSGGFKISALDIERKLIAHPNIKDVAVIGVPDFTWGEKVACILVWKGSEAPFDSEDLKAWCKEQMPPSHVPSIYKLVEDMLPRNAMGKINKKLLLKEFFPNK